MVTWGIVALLFTWVSSATGLYILRFLLGLYALAFFLPAIIAGFEAQYGTKFSVYEKGLITAIPYLPAAIVLYLWSRDATKRGVKTWHIAVPAAIGAISIPLALFMGSPTATIGVITITACAIFAALPNFWTVPSRFLTGAAAAAGIALINTSEISLDSPLATSPEHLRISPAAMWFPCFVLVVLCCCRHSHGCRQHEG